MSLSIIEYLVNKDTLHVKKNANKIKLINLLFPEIKNECKFIGQRKEAMSIYLKKDNSIKSFLMPLNY